MPTATRLDTDMSHWGGGVEHYLLDDGSHDGSHVAVSVDVGPDERAQAHISETLGVIGGTIHRYDMEPTVILACDEHGQAISLDRLHTSPPGTSHADALAALGYTEVDT